MKINIFSIILLSTSAHAGWAEETLAHLSLRQKIGQLCMVATTAAVLPPSHDQIDWQQRSAYNLNHDHLELLIEQYSIGGIIFLYKGSTSRQIELTNRFQALSAIPLLVGQDCEWGLAMRHENAVRFPKNLTLGAMQDHALLYAVGKEIGEQCKAIGVHINFAPVVDSNTNPDNPVIHDRAFGDTKEHVATCGATFMHGLQDAGILACAKHFPGHGDTNLDSHYHLPTILKNKDELHAQELYPFKQLIDAGVAAVMNAHLLIPAFDDSLPASLSGNVVTNILQKELGFKGLVFTDGLGMKALTNHYSAQEVALKALQAGNDILLCPILVPETIAYLEQAVTEGILSEKKVNKKVLKLLRIKEKLHLNKEKFIDEKQALARIHDASACQLKKMAFEKAITLICNNNMLPLAYTENTCIFHCTPHNSMFDRILEIPSFTVASETIPKCAALTKNYQTIIVTCAPEKNKQLYGFSLEFLTFLKNLSGKTVIIALFGTPYSIPLFLELQPDALIMGYENDVDAFNTVAHVIKGTLRAEGKLPIFVATRSL
ncbi:MAG: glycoside hydrolase family 3 protein [Candidatus Babeliales bacterium]